MESIARRARLARQWERELATMPDGAQRAALQVRLFELQKLLRMLTERALSIFGGGPH
jgi:hypothetical protein